MILLDNVNTTVTSSTFTSRGGKAVVIIRGDDYTGVDVSIQAASKNDATRFTEIDSGNFTADATQTIDYLPAGVLVRAVCTGAGAGDNIFCEILQ